jgi:regulator of RNase E activity RraA
MTDNPTTAPISEETRERLARASTATLTTLLFKRGLRNAFIQGVRPLNPKAPPLVGPAFTLRYIPAREDLDHMGVFEDYDHPQRRAIETCPPGAVLVVDCRRNTRVASAGNILITRLMVRGCAGFVSDGGLRDSTEIAAMDFPAYCAGPSAPTNLIQHHALDLNNPIGCGEVPVYPGDVVVGDGEGVVVIPRHLADEVAADAAEQERLEAFILEEIRGGKALRGVYPPDADTRARYQTWRKGQTGG